MDDLAAFLDELRRRLSSGPAAQSGVAVASIVRHRGSTPRKTGAKMLVDPTGGSVGTVGGGCGEAEVMSRAQRVLATRAAQRVEVSLLEEDGWESPSICGGVLDVFVERVGEDVGTIPLPGFFAALDEARARGVGLAIVSLTAAPRGAALPLGRKTLVDERGVQQFRLGDAPLDEAVVEPALAAIARGEPGEVELDAPHAGFRFYVEPLCEPPELVVVGAGHVGAALARIAPHVGFQTVVLDDRASFANPIRLPGATRILLGDPRDSLGALDPRRSRYVVLVTRGHRLDADCLRRAIGMDLAYLGMIGSRRRVRRILETLAEEGVSGARLAAVRAPIGLDVGAETPGEIAVAILAEMIDVRRRGGAGAVALSRARSGRQRRNADEV